MQDFTEFNEQHKMQCIPQEIVREIFKYVPEYGFLVCQELHIVPEYNKCSFYCDTKHFMLCIKDLKTGVQLAYSIIGYCLTEDDSCKINWLKDIANFEPYKYAINLCKQNLIEMVGDIIRDDCPGHVRDHLVEYFGVKGKYSEVNTTKIVGSNLAGTLIFWVPIVAYHSGLVTFEEAKQRIWADRWNDQETIIDCLSYVMLCASGKFYETLVLMFGYLMPKVMPKLLRRANKHSDKFSDQELIGFMETFGIEGLTVADINYRPKCIEYLFGLIYKKYADDPVMTFEKLYEYSMGLLKLYTDK